MKKISVPKQIRKIAAIRILERFLLLAVLLLVAYVFADYVIKNIYEEANFGNYSFTLFFIYIIPFWLSKIPKKLFDRDWYGEILSFETNNHEFKFFDGKDKREKFSLHALIKEPNGKLHTHRINKEKLFKPGDKVIHVYGMDYITPIRTPSNPGKIVCVCCGGDNETELKHCRYCACTLDVKLVDEKKG